MLDFKFNSKISFSISKKDLMWIMTLVIVLLRQHLPL
ncbi:hypothetical protein EV382_4466 [Micromonospora violae]|uniref:Uncharacterized protein n=1 Tax=Micromonospora violae TaxID=1278207 RepID=A0A4Q7UNA2_9ACTN|nr:hypothetical protein EV382_4466 [Micromonospora violae]